MRCLDAYALDQFHSELINDITPAAEGKYSTFATDTTEEALIASRDHRGFGGFSMGAVNTWCTFRYAMDYFRYFMPMSGSYGEAEDTGETDGTKSMQYKKDSLITNVMADSSFSEYGISVSSTNVFPRRFFMWMKSI